VTPSLDPYGGPSDSPFTVTPSFEPYGTLLESPSPVTALLSAAVDSWDRIREGAFRVLMRFPGMLPGLGAPADVAGVATWAGSLVVSPRVRESDAGSLVLRLLFKKYVAVHRWRIQFVPPRCTTQRTQRVL